MYREDMRRILTLSLALVLLSPMAIGQETLRGYARSVDASSLKIAGRTVHLADIVTPPLRAPCLWRNNKARDCGRMARAGLTDLLAGAEVVCRKSAGKSGWRCLADGYDVAEGLVHAGWARPAPGAPKVYFEEMMQARERGLMLWSATTLDGRPFMDTVRPATNTPGTPSN